MGATVRRTALLAFAAALMIGPLSARAQGVETPNVALYETMESMTVGGSGNVIRRATAALTGWTKAGSPICPASLGVEICTVNVVASDSVRIDTGKGTVTGDFSVVVPCETFPPRPCTGDNPFDSPEITVLSGTLRADIDLAPIHGVPFLADLTGSLQGLGTKGGPLDRVVFRATFTGTFRLPFEIPPGDEAYYVVDPAQWPKPESLRRVLNPDEYVFAGAGVKAYPMVLLELTVK
jgi:hypothetical protein